MLPTAHRIVFRYPKYIHDSNHTHTLMTIEPSCLGNAIQKLAQTLELEALQCERTVHSLLKKEAPGS